MDIEKIGNKVENENNEKAPKKALGRGLAALLGGSGDNFLDEMDEEFKGESEKITVVGDGVQELDIEKVQANPDQPRKHFNHAKLAELAESIKEQGLIQPILVKPVNGQNGEEVFQIIAGERRWRAHQIAELKTVKAIVVKKEESDEKNDLASVIENIQRLSLIHI